MEIRRMHDVAVIGGGVMGCATALRLAEGGMRVALLERETIGAGASGVNAGTLSLQVKRLSLLHYAMRGSQMWARMDQSLGFDVHFRQPGGLNLAFTDAEADTLMQRSDERRAAGLPIEIVDSRKAREIEPHLTDKIAAAAFCPLDGFVDANVVSLAFRKALIGAGISLHERAPVHSIAHGPHGYDLRCGEKSVGARRIVLAAGAWSAELLTKLGIDLPIAWRVNQMSVTERARKLLNGVVGHVSGLMSLKQAANGTIIIGGGWQGIGKPGGPGEAIPQNLVGNLQFALTALPALRSRRLVRTWYGYDAVTPDVMPLVGPIPGLDNAFLIACVRGGYTIGPYIGRLLADCILGHEPELPLFPLDRFTAPVKQEA
jgi:sarcosine oxidase subunit beta